ncbi:MAG: c-type cytochrome biogenesis protein CcmI [Moraxella sp.]|nr:c-type cytochrome biogenesis protein CcmI [Moraxella sp.]
MTPTLMLFFSLCVLLCVLLALVVIRPWLGGQKTDDNRLMALNVAIFHDRLAELDSDRQSGLIDEMTYQNQQTELKRQLINAQTSHDAHKVVGIKSRLIVIVWIVLLASLAYLTVGNRTGVFKLWYAQDTVGQVADELLTGKIDTPPKWATTDSSALISAMQTNVHHHAHDPQRWLRLSELFMALDAKPQALEALSRAYRLNPADEEIALTYAQTSFFINNGSLDSQAKNALLGILVVNPNHEGVQMMMAMGEMRAGNFANAKAWVARLRSSIAKKSGDRSEALASLDELTANIDAQEAKAQAGVNITVSVADTLLPQIGESDVVFVSITGTDGKAPYAVKRLPVSDIKNGVLTVSLSDLDAMMPSRTLSSGRGENDTLMVNARISRTGNAISESGDLSANPVVLSKTANTATISITQVVP